MNPQQPEDNASNPNQPQNQPTETTPSAPGLPQVEQAQPPTALPPENHAWPQPVAAPPEQPAASTETPFAPVASHTSKRLKKILIVVAVAVAIILLIPVFIVIVGAPKLKQASNDTAIKNDVAIIASELNKYRSTTSSYPAVAQFYDGTFRPEGVIHLNSSDAVNYVPTPDGCDAKEVPCTGFTLTTKLDSGKDYTVSN